MDVRVLGVLFVIPCAVAGAGGIRHAVIWALDDHAADSASANNQTPPETKPEPDLEDPELKPETPEPETPEAPPAPKPEAPPTLSRSAEPSLEHDPTETRAGLLADLERAVPVKDYELMLACKLRAHVWQFDDIENTANRFLAEWAAK